MRMDEFLFIAFKELSASRLEREDLLTAIANRFERAEPVYPIRTCHKQTRQRGRLRGDQLAVTISQDGADTSARFKETGI
jgi:hypothetical protein